LINPQFPIAQLGDGNQYLIQLLVDEVDISKIELKQPVLISLDAYPNQVFNAIVSKIYPIKDNRSQTFTIEAIFTTFPKKLYAGLSGEANIIINRREKVLTLPTYSLINDSTVNTSDGERIIQIGYKSFDKIEVISGIDSSTVVLLP
jgi:multidrug efflux pump subunit AcrA (membrane-fusion protein)